MMTEIDMKKFPEWEDLDRIESFDDYQTKAGTFAQYPKENEAAYLALGLTSEAGEVADKIKKKIRDGKFDRKELAKELGDCLWYISLMATHLDYNMSEIAQMNVDKLSSRTVRNKIQGSGDNR
tara:strand:+ start:6548 stop:6916 length:369 start_codon:yes stop_codon:yes gene_type:complete